MDWSCELTTKKLPEKIRKYFNSRADFLFNDLLENRYDGGLVKLSYTNIWSSLILWGSGETPFFIFSECPLIFFVVERPSLVFWISR